MGRDHDILNCNDDEILYEQLSGCQRCYQGLSWSENDASRLIGSWLLNLLCIDGNYKI